MDYDWWFVLCQVSVSVSGNVVKDAIVRKLGNIRNWVEHCIYLENRYLHFKCRYAYLYFEYRYLYLNKNTSIYIKM